MSDTLVLYGNRPVTSPWVLSVFVALEEKGLPFTFEQLDLTAGEQRAPGFVAGSLTNRVPTLVHNGVWISESSAITEYLDEVFAPPRYPAIYPSEPKARARVRMVQALIRSDFQAVREERPTETIFVRPTEVPLSDKAVAATNRLFRIATALLDEHETSLTGTFTIADVDLALMLQRLLANGDPVPPPLAAYARVVWQRPSVVKWLALAHTKE